MYGASTSNQRIESWWSIFRKQRSQFWIDFFGDLREKHLFNGCQEHMSLVRYCFLDLLQKELDDYRRLWNTHTIRPVRQSRCPSCKPEAMYHVPQRFHGRNCGFLTSSQMLDHLHSLLPPLATPRDELQPVFDEMQQQRGLTTPLQWECAVENYIILKDLAGL
uniref:Integrase core domain-containing protein n=1 Tax=Knipowitschia caucasica TaxID=637954 RepID=A0AAV2KRA3_KNICA